MSNVKPFVPLTIRGSGAFLALPLTEDISLFPDDTFVEVSTDTAPLSISKQSCDQTRQIPLMISAS